MADPLRQAYLEAMGITLWERRVLPEPEALVPAASDEPAAGAAEEKPVAEVPPAVSSESAPLDWAGLAARVAECRACPELVANRSRTVFGVGNREASIIVVGEAPGADEDRQGEPFVGRAGKLLDNMLRAIGFPRPTVYIANILKCRPPNNRDPQAEEAAACAAFLHRQIELVQPKLLLVVGRIAAQRLLESDQPIGRLRGRVHRHGVTGLPLVVTYHPAYLLRSPGQKRAVWDDLRLALAVHREAAVEGPA